MISDKVGPHHLERKAILYVRQSSAHQVLHNRESSALQYAMRDRLMALGWSEIEVIYDDLGRSAAGGVQRAGFERMVAEVCLGKVGAVCAREVSRFARNSRDWQQLIEMCRVVDTVLVDQETIYAPRHGNDRLLLGLKDTMLLDGDNVRHGLNRDLGFTEADRVENIRRAGEVAKLMVDSGLIVICSFISLYRAEREMVRALVGDGEFIEVFVDTPIEECVRRDPKGLYSKAKAGKIKNFTGIDAPYEAPEQPEIRLDTVGRPPEQLAEEIIALFRG